MRSGAARKKEKYCPRKNYSSVAALAKPIQETPTPAGERITVRRAAHVKNAHTGISRWQFFAERRSGNPGAQSVLIGSAEPGERWAKVGQGGLWAKYR